LSEEKPRVYKRAYIASLELNNGDRIEIGLGRQRLLCTFRGFDRFLYVFVVDTDEGEMVIPFRSIRYVKKVRGGQTGGEAG